LQATKETLALIDAAYHLYPPYLGNQNYPKEHGDPAATQ